MEASAAAAGQGDGGQGQGEGGEATQQAGPDLSAVVEQLGQVREGNEELRQFLQSQPWQQQAQETGQQEPAVPELDLSALGEDEYGQQIAQSLTGYVGQMLQQQTQPLMDRIEAQDNILKEWKQTAAANDFAAEFPEVTEPETAKQVMGMTRDFAEQLGHPELGENFALARVLYAAGRAFEMAQAESTEEGPQAAHLEGGSGAGPGAGGQSDLKQQILQANQGSRVLPF